MTDIAESASLLEPTLVTRLAGVVADSPLAAAIATRAEATRQAEASARALFDTVDAARLSPRERYAFALATAETHADATLVAHYGERLAAAGGAPREDARFVAALRHARRIAAEPVRAQAADLRGLEALGWSADAILTIVQIVAFTSFQGRLVGGLRLLAGDPRGTASPAVEVGAGIWHASPVTTGGRLAPTAFTRDSLGWEPWLAPRDRVTLSAREIETLERNGHLDSDYFMLLARDLPLLDHRTRTDKGIFYTPGGLKRAERELAATVTSKVNGCVFCASVHARKAAQLSGETEAIDSLLAVVPGADLAAGQSPRWQAQIRFAAQFAATPAAATVDHVARLREQGLDDLELLDLVQSVAFFSWANRLMLTLGEPYVA